MVGRKTSTEAHTEPTDIYMYSTRGGCTSVETMPAGVIVPPLQTSRPEMKFVRKPLNKVSNKSPQTLDEIRFFLSHFRMHNKMSAYLKYGSYLRLSQNQTFFVVLDVRKQFFKVSLVFEWMFGLTHVHSRKTFRNCPQISEPQAVINRQNLPLLTYLSTTRLLKRRFFLLSNRVLVLQFEEIRASIGLKYAPWNAPQIDAHCSTLHFKRDNGSFRCN